MKEFLELAQLFEQHGRPTNYHTFLEHPDVQILKTLLGKELTSVFLCFLSQRCKPDQALLERLVRYRNENRLRDLEAAIIELSTLGFVMNAMIIHALCGKAGKETSFLPSVKLLQVAKQAGLLNAETNIVSEEVLRLLNIEKINLYHKLIEKSALNLNVLQNASFSNLPSMPVKIEACVDIYYYATLCACTAVLNTSKDKIDVLDLWGVCDIAKTLQSLHETQRLTTESFLLTCKVKYGLSSLLSTLELLEENALDTASFCRQIISQKDSFSNLSDCYKILVLIKRCNLAPMNDGCIQSLIILAKTLSPLLNSLNYLELRAALTPSCFTCIMDYYEGERCEELAISVEPANKKQRSTLSYGFFSSSTLKETPTFEIGAVLFALSQAHLLENNREWISDCFTLSRADFIQQLFRLGELNQHNLSVARETNFDKECLTQLMVLAQLHVPFPGTLPTLQVMAYLQCLASLAPLSAPLPTSIQTFAFTQPVLLKRILTLLNLSTPTALTLDVVMRLVESCESATDSIRFLDEKILCACLQWPMTEVKAIVESGGTGSCEELFGAFQILQEAGIHVSPTSDNNFILPGLYKTSDSIQDVKIIIALSAVQAFNQNTWTLVCSVDANIKPSLRGIIQRLTQHHQCNLTTLTLILTAKKCLLALEVFLLLTTENLSVSSYWNTLMQHPHPLLLCRGLVELKARKLLVDDYFFKIAKTKQPLLAVNALAQLLLAGIPLVSCWDEIAEAENPEECAQMAMGSTTLGKLNEDLPSELRSAVVHHTQPKLAQQHLKMLLLIPHVTSAHILQILPREDVDDIVQALIQFNKSRPLNDALIALMIHNSHLLIPLKSYSYASLDRASQALFIQFSQTASVQEAEDWLEREQIIKRHPHVATRLRECMTETSKQRQWIVALTLLNSVDEVNETSIAYLQRSRDPEKSAEMMVALKKSELYTSDYLDRAFARESQASGVFKALHSLAEGGNLNAPLFNFVMINSQYATVEAATCLMRVPDILPAHFDWLATYPNERFGNAAVVIIQELYESQTLNRSWVEKLMQKEKVSLIDIANQLQYIPSDLLENVIVEKIFTAEGICYLSDEEVYYNPFEKFQKNNPSLLTKEVIQVILMQPSGKSYTVYYNMLALEEAVLFHPEIILCCTTKERTQAIIALSKAQQWNETNKAIVLTSRNPSEEVALIISLVQQNKYSPATAALLLLRLELIQSNQQAKQLAGQYSYYFSSVLQELLVKRPMLQESTVQCLLSTDVKWESMAIILELLKDDALTDDSLCLIAVTDQFYLHTYLQYMHDAFDAEMSFSEFLKLCHYESYLNQPELLKVIESTVSYKAKQKPLDTTNMQQLLSDLWCLCQAGDQAAITERILSPTASVAATVCRVRP